MPLAFDPPFTVGSLLRAAEVALRSSTESPALDAELLLAHTLGVSRARLHAHPEAAVTEADAARFSARVQERSACRPLAQIVGQREFWSLPLQVSSATLTPRPDTERLVELSLERLPADAGRHVLDLGTGTGAIAIAIASERPQAKVVATDACTEALAIASRNAAQLGFAVEFRSGSWYEAVSGHRFDLIISNPPYIADDEWSLTDPELAFEPRMALAAGPDGLDALRVIIAGAPAHLTPGGSILLEHGFRQGPAVAALLAAAGFSEVRTHRDYAGKDRVTGGTFPRADGHRIPP